MQFLENKIPPPIVAMTMGFAMWVISIYGPTVEIATLPRLVLISTAILLGALFCGFGVISFRRASTTVNPLKPETASSLVTSGIYQVSRNPMYVGFTLFLLAWAIQLGSPLALIGIPAYISYMNRFQVLSEERAMTALFGDEFLQYKSRVRRWL